VQNEQEMKKFLSQTMDMVTNTEGENQSFTHDSYSRKVEKSQKENMNPRSIPNAPSSAKNSAKPSHHSNRSSKPPVMIPNST
jgi:hypothetical protein